MTMSLIFCLIIYVLGLYTVSSLRTSPVRTVNTVITSPAIIRHTMPRIAAPLRASTPQSSSVEEAPELPGWIQTSNRLTVSAIKAVLAFVIPTDRPYARFYALETIARVPYFSYTSVLYLYETFGWFRKSDYIKVHFAESWNELHHLKIMESLGGNEEFSDRFIAQHIAFFYYWLVVVIYISSPAIAYDLNKYVERHAYNTYKEFAEVNEQSLRQLPAPQIALDYYGTTDQYMFDAFQSSIVLSADPSSGPRRRPVIESLYDVFVAIRDDEAEHAATMEKLERDVALTSRGKQD